MIACEIQLWYVIPDKIRDKIQSEKKIREKEFFVGKQNCQKKNLSRTLSQISRLQSELSQTNRCLSLLSGTYIPQ